MFRETGRTRRVSQETHTQMQRSANILSLLSLKLVTWLEFLWHAWLIIILAQPWGPQSQAPLTLPTHQFWLRLSSLEVPQARNWPHLTCMDPKLSETSNHPKWIFFKKTLNFFLLCVGIVLCLQRPEKDMRSLGTAIAGSCQSSDRCKHPVNLGLRVFLTTEPPLLHHPSRVMFQSGHHQPSKWHPADTKMKNYILARIFHDKYPLGCLLVYLFLSLTM